MQTIVVGYDGGEAAKRALERAAEFARRFQARVVVVAVGSGRQPVAEAMPAQLEPTLIAAGPVGPMVAAPPPEVEPTGLPSEEEKILERARNVLAQRHLEAEFVSAVGDPAETLLETAEAQDADLIVVGSPERGFLERLLGSGVDDKVAHRAHRDVLLVH